LNWGEVAASGESDNIGDHSWSKGDFKLPRLSKESRLLELDSMVLFVLLFF